MRNVLSFIATHKIILLPIVALTVGGYYFTHRPQVSYFETVKVSSGNVVQEVSVTGRVNSESEVDLALEKGGRVSSEPRQVGENVSAGDVLVRTDSSELNALRAQALANLDLELANLSSIQKGSRAEDIAISRSQVDSATSVMKEGQKTVLDRSRTAYTVSDDAIHNIADQFFRNPKTGSPELILTVSDSKLAIALPQELSAIEASFAAWKKDTESWDESSDADIISKTTSSHIDQVKKFFDDLALAVNSLQSNSSLSQTSIDGWKLDVSGARTNINNSISSLLAAVEKYKTAKEALTVAENQLALKVAGPTPEAIAAEEAKIAGVRASVKNYDAQIAKTVLTSPIAGVITKQDAKLGQTVGPNIPIVTVMSDKHFKIEANVPEADVAKVRVGDPAEITFDAYGSDTFFNATVKMIDPAETVIGGVSTYKVTLYLDHDDARIRSGMTANINIDTDKREGVLMIPNRAVVSHDDKKFVKVPNADMKTAHEVEIETGLRGSDGNIEIVKGLTLGQEIIIHDNTPK